MPSVRPHKKAADLLQDNAGVQLAPLRAPGIDLSFNAHHALDNEDGILKLRDILNKDLLTFKLRMWLEVMQFCSWMEIGQCFLISIAADEVIYLAELKEAIVMILTGKGMRPVLPRRKFLQWHGGDIYSPDSEDVFWVDAENWLCDTRATEEDLNQAGR